MIKRYYDQKTNVQNFRTNDEVYLLKEPVKGKFADQYSESYKIIEISMNNVKINFKGKPRVIHVNKLKSFKKLISELE